MNITIDINIRASEDITNSILTLAAVLHNAVPIFDKSPKVIEAKEEPSIKNEAMKAPKEMEISREKVETSKEEVKEITIEEVRATLARLSEKGKDLEVKALIKKFGVKKISDIPKEKYEQLLSEAQSFN